MTEGLHVRLAEVMGRDVPRETFRLIAKYAQLLVAANAEQNLISAASTGALWERHIVDSAQLVRYQPNLEASWVDIGSGAGLPGLIVAVLTRGPVTLVEPRRLRAEFLSAVVGELGLAQRVTVVPAKIDTLRATFDTITARAVAPADRLFALAAASATARTIWILPKGRSGKSELAAARRNWQGAFRVERSMTDKEAVILIAAGVSRKART